MVCKAAFQSVNNNVDKNKPPWTKSKLHHTNNKTTKMVMPFDKSNNNVRNKPLKPNIFYMKQPKPSKHATENKKRSSHESGKKKPHASRSTKK